MKRRTFLELSAKTTSGFIFSSSLYSCNVKKGLIKNTKKMGRYDNIIVGSGYGGAVTALRLTEKGHKVLLLEMGMKWPTSEHNNTFCKMITPDKRSSWLSNTPNSPIPLPIPIKKYTGVLDKIRFKEMSIFAGRAYGGGSIANGGIAITPKREYVETIFPDIDITELYKTYFPLANKELNVNKIPRDFYTTTPYYQFSRKAEEQAHKAGLKTEFFDSTYNFDYMQLEAEGKVYKSGLGGEVIYGNNAGKYSLDKTYLKKAEATGLLETKTLREVIDITQLENGEFALNINHIRTDGSVQQREVYTCKKLFLNAGSVGTSKLLVKAKHTGSLPKLNNEIGLHWGPNGNIMTGRNFVKAAGLKQSCIPIKGINMWEGYDYKIFAELAPLPLGIETWTTLYLSISDNPERGKFVFDTATNTVKLDWRKEQNKYSRKAAKLFLERLRKANGGTRSHLLFNNGFGDDFCYHPLGGCALGKATDLFGRVKGYNNLYVNDGALIPGSAGVNPFVFITGLAERNMDEILKKDFN